MSPHGRHCITNTSCCLRSTHWIATIADWVSFFHSGARVLLPIAAHTLCACGVSEDTALNRSPIARGTVTADDPAVVAIAMGRSRCDAPPSPPSCTGTLIHPRVVLTAAHCIEPAETGVGYEVLFGRSSNASDAKIRIVAARLRHPEYNPKTQAYDVALLRLADDAPVAPIAMSTALPVIGATIRVVGYGLTEDPTVVPGTKRSGTMTITAVGVTTFRAEPAPSNSCRADSGGPVLAGSPETLLGVTVSGDPACLEYASNGRVDVLRPVIDAFVKETDQTPKGPQWAACLCDPPCPEDIPRTPTETGPRAAGGGSCATSQQRSNGAWPTIVLAMVAITARGRCRKSSRPS